MRSVKWQEVNVSSSSRLAHKGKNVMQIMFKHNFLCCFRKRSVDMFYWLGIAVSRNLFFSSFRSIVQQRGLPCTLTCSYSNFKVFIFYLLSIALAYPLNSVILCLSWFRVRDTFLFFKVCKFWSLSTAACTVMTLPNSRTVRGITCHYHQSSKDCQLLK